MTVYSHSRLSCFEQCPQKYKLNYIDRVEPEVERKKAKAALTELFYETKTEATPKMIVGILILLTVLNGSIILTLQNFCDSPLEALVVNPHPVDVPLLTFVDF